MTQTTQMGEAELEHFIKVTRVNGDPSEYYRVEDMRNIPITATEYTANTGEDA